MRMPWLRASSAASRGVALPRFWAPSVSRRMTRDRAGLSERRRTAAMRAEPMAVPSSRLSRSSRSRIE